MIYVGKSPYRVSLLGGGSDLDWFVKEEKFGVCLGYSLDQYSYSVLNILKTNDFPTAIEPVKPILIIQYTLFFLKIL